MAFPGNNIASTSSPLVPIYQGSAAGGDLTGTYPNPTIVLRAVTSDKIAVGGVGTTNLADFSVTLIKLSGIPFLTSPILLASNIGSGILTNDHISNNADISTSKLHEGSRFIKDYGNQVISGIKIFNRTPRGITQPLIGTDLTNKTYVDNYVTLSGTGSSGTLSGNGTAGYISKYNTATTLGNSLIFQVGNYIGVNTNSPAGSLHIVGDRLTNHALVHDVFNASNVNAAGLHLESARGTSGSATTTPLQADDFIGYVSFKGFDPGTGTWTGGKANLAAFAAENWSASAQGAYLSLGTTPIAGTTRSERIRIADSGKVGISTSAPTEYLSVNGNVNASGLTIHGGILNITRGGRIEGFGIISGANISANSVLTGHLAANSVTGNEILNASISGAKIAADSVLQGHIANDAVGSNEIINSSISGNKISANSILTGHLANDSVTSNQILNSSISGNKIAANSILQGHLADSSVGSNQIVNSSISGNKIGANSILQGHLADNSVGSFQIINSSISGNKIQALALLTGHYADGSIINDKLAESSISGAKIQANAILQGHLADNSVGLNQIINSSISGNKVQALSLLTGHYADNSIISSKLADSIVSGNKIQADAILQGHIANDAVGSNEIINSSISGNKIAANSVLQGHLANNSVGSAQIIDSSISGNKITANTILQGHLSNSSVSGNIIGQQFVLPNHLAANPTIVKSTDYTITDNDWEKTIYLSPGSGGAGFFTITLPSTTGRGGRGLTFVKADKGTNYIIIAPASGEQINGDAQLFIRNYSQAFVIRTNGFGNWYIDTGIVPYCISGNALLPQSVLTEHIKDTPKARVSRSLSTLVPSSTIKYIEFNTVSYDTNSFFNGAATDKLTINEAGKYLIQGEYVHGANAAGSRHLFIYQNLGIVSYTLLDPVQATYGTSLQVGTTLSCAAGDYIRLAAFQNSGSVLSGDVSFIVTSFNISKIV